MTRPTIVYDDDCGFCTWSAEYADAHGNFHLLGFSKLTPEERARLPDDYEDCMHVFDGDDTYSCGEAAEFVASRLSTAEGTAARVFQSLPEGARRHVRDPTYRFIADHRDWFGKVRSKRPPARD
ncbi:thiol-disulfide oxidoreductase DCC family protein [Halorubellus salinus]|uniref:thiol-disulfide oxidoreductase DCC family protein n=1 Tax=Halorubellus salinus TaxID=755309 RepID=UPI001D06DC71|nr:DCC1-like thiol-disulfide oxidoreductase family protein [Halorubellus salinus]